MFNLTIELAGAEPVTLDDMGCGSLVFSQHSEISDSLERIVLDWSQLKQAFEAALSRYGTEAKNTDRNTIAVIDDIDCILRSLG